MASNIDYNRNLYSSLANSNRYPKIRQRIADSAATVTVSSRPVQTDGSSEYSGMLGLTFEGIKELLKSYWDGTVPEQKPQDNQPTQPAQTYTARQGDTLLTIATNTLGDGTRWNEIWELNKDQLSDPNGVIPGMILKMPTASAPATPNTPNTPTAPTAPAAPETPAAPEPEGSGPLLKSGSRGDAVSKLQSRLLELGCDPGGIDGIMGPNTVNAVKAFQASKGLEADGIVGPLTWKQLGIKVDEAAPASPPPSTEGSGPLLKSGSRGDAVSKLQSRLLELGCDPGGVDGIMGPNTVNAVKAFQASKGLEVDGIVGPATWKQLGIVVEVSVNSAGDSNEQIDIGGPQPAVTRQGSLIGVGIAAQFDAMVAAAAAEGVELRINSGYRTHAEQQALWDENPDPTYVAYPGTSNHEAGNAIDFYDIGDAWGWLANNAPNFGFYNYAPEPWHYSLDGG